MNQNPVDEAMRAGFGMGFLCGFSFFVFVLFLFLFTTPWLRAYLSGAGVPVFSIIGMRLRGSPVAMLVDTKIALEHSGIQADIRQVESAYLANRHRIVQPGDLLEIVKAGLEAVDSRPAWAGPIAASIVDDKSMPR
jgi:uncharacterized protein YqfA (UPF0365 family)